MTPTGARMVAAWETISQAVIAAARPVAQPSKAEKLRTQQCVHCRHRWAPPCGCHDDPYCPSCGAPQSAPLNPPPAGEAWQKERYHFTSTPDGDRANKAAQGLAEAAATLDFARLGQRLMGARTAEEIGRIVCALLTRYEWQSGTKPAWMTEDKILDSCIEDAAAKEDVRC